MGQYVVTGVAGFIGAAVAKSLLADGHQVLGIDDLRPTYDVRLKRHRLAQLDPKFGDTSFKLSVNGPLGVILARARLEEWSPEDILQENDGEPFDAVIHLAANAGVRQSVENPEPYFTDNIEGMRVVLEWVRQGAAKRLVYASSSSVNTPRYDNALEVGADDDRPRTPYAASKRMNELMAIAYAHSFGVKSVGLRFFSVYGPAGRPDSRASIFQYVRQLAEGEAITVYGDPHQMRDFTHIDDTVAMVRKAAFGGLQHGKVYNAGLGQPRRVLEVIQWIADLIGCTPTVTFKSDPRSDTRLTFANVETEFKALAAAPIPFRFGLQACVDWYIANREWAKEITP